VLGKSVGTAANSKVKSSIKVQPNDSISTTYPTAGPKRQQNLMFASLSTTSKLFGPSYFKHISWRVKTLHYMFIDQKQRKHTNFSLP